MVTVKPIKRHHTILYKKAAALVSLVFLWIGVRYISWFISIIGGSRAKSLRPNRREQELVLQASSSALKQRSDNILKNLGELSTLMPLIPSSGNDSSNDSRRSLLSKFSSTIRKECIPGRDDSSGEINPTTRRKRECLRHVPLGKANNNGDLESRVKAQKPRIGILIPPGVLSSSFASLLSNALLDTSRDVMRMDLDVIITSRVPVYGYGKSHGYTKLIRFINCGAGGEGGMFISVVDAYLFGASVLRHGQVSYDTQSEIKTSLDDILGKSPPPPSEGTLGRILQLILRWHCRLSRERSFFIFASCYAVICVLASL